MKIDLIHRERWHELNEVLQGRAAIEGAGVQLCTSAAFTIHEVTSHLIRQFPQKKVVHLFKHMSPHFEPIAASLAREGLKVEIHPWGLPQVEECLKTIDKNTLCILFAYDNPLTGELYDTSTLEAKASELKTFTLGLSHAKHLYRPLSAVQLPYAVRVCLLNQQLSLLYVGERLKSLHSLSEWQSWPQTTAEQLNHLLQKKIERKTEVQKFESAPIAGFKAFFTHEERLFDRSVFYWEDLDATGLIEVLSQIRQHKLGPPGEDHYIEAASLSRWGGMRTQDWLKHQNLNEKIIRGLVVLAAAWINNEISTDLNKAHQKILQLQSGQQ